MRLSSCPKDSGDTLKKINTILVLTIYEVFDHTLRMKNRIRDIRKSLGLTQEEFGEILGITYVQVGRLERGQRQLREETMKEYASKLNEAGYSGILPWHFIIDADSAQNNIDPKKKKIIDILDKLNDKEQDLYLSMGEAFLKEKNAESDP